MAKDKVGGGGFQRILPDTEPQLAIVVQIVGLGTQNVKKWRSEEYEQKRQLIIFYELYMDRHEFQGEEKPLVHKDQFTRSLGERANLTKWIVGYRGQEWLDKQEEIDWKEFVPALGMITCGRKKNKAGDREYATTENFTRLPKAYPKEAKPAGKEDIYNPVGFFDIEDEVPEWDKFLILYPWVQIVVSESEEFQKLYKAGKVPAEALNALQEAKDAKEKRQNKDNATPPEQSAEDKAEQERLARENAKSDDELFGGGSEASDNPFASSDDDSDGDPFALDEEEDPFKV